MQHVVKVQSNHVVSGPVVVVIFCVFAMSLIVAGKKLLWKHVWLVMMLSAQFRLRLYVSPSSTH